MISDNSTISGTGYVKPDHFFVKPDHFFVKPDHFFIKPDHLCQT